MSPTELLAQRDSAWRAYKQERDPFIKREHKKTFKHLNRQYIKATKHEQPWHGIFRTGLRLVILLLILIGGVVWILRDRDWEIICGVLVISAIVFSMLLAAIFFVKRRIDKETYTELVGSALRALPKLETGTIPSLTAGDDAVAKDSPQDPK